MRSTEQVTPEEIGVHMIYTEHEKISFIERMWAEGLRPATAQKLWGYPDRSSLCKWEKEALAGKLDAKRPPQNPKACKHIWHQAYPEETKEEALRLYSLGKRPAQIAEILNMPNGAIISVWANKARKNAKIPFVKSESRDKDRVNSVTDTNDTLKKTSKANETEVKHLKEALAKANAALADQEKDMEALAALFFDPKVGCLANQSTRQKVEFAEKLRKELGLTLRIILNSMHLSKSTYEYHKKKSDEGISGRSSDADIEERVKEIFEVNGNCSRGYRFVHEVLANDGVVVSEKRIRRIMKRLGLEVIYKKHSKKYNSYEGEIDDGAPNLVLNKHKRHVFRADSPFSLWLTDVSEFSIPAGKLYLSPIIDCKDGALISWNISIHPDSELVNSMLKSAITLLPVDCAGLILHTDRGGLYRTDSWKEICESANITRSMSRKATSPDNAAMEAFFGRMKNEMFYGRDWRFESLEDLEYVMDTYLSEYNEKRLKSFCEGDKGPKGGKRGKLVYDTINNHRIKENLDPMIAIKAVTKAA